MPRGHVLPDGATIAALRGEAGLTQDELASRAGYGLRTIGNVEGGRPTTANTLTALATVLSGCLRRPVPMTDLLARRREMHSGHSWERGLTFRDNVKMLELRQPGARGSSPSGSHNPTAVLTDTFVVRNLPAEVSEINFYYCNESGQVQGRSLTHPRDVEWIPSCGLAEDRRQHAGRDRLRVLRLRLSDARSQAAPIVQHQLEFASPVGPAPRNYLRGHVAYPTESLALLVSFPPDYQVQSLQAAWRRGPSGPLVPAAEAPVHIAGPVAYWRVSGAQPGETYELSWT